MDLSQVVSTEYRADHVAVIRDGERAKLAVVVEIQRQIDRGKQRSWPVYVAAARASLGCPVVLLVIAPEARVARWARGEIETGHPGFTLRPLVVSYAEVPRVMVAAEASRHPELAVLSVLAHRGAEEAEAAVAALRELPEERSRLYFDVIMAALPELARRTLEAHMEGYEYQSEFARKYVAQGREEGREEGRVEGLKRGLAAGLQEGQRAAALALARLKVGTLSEAQAAGIDALEDSAALTQLLLELGMARDAEEARLALARLADPR